ncbi:hypothetical protein IFR05_012868 [Cadophora sp. M221]|nr:hypothetical protein IFR05_012868 [Cadophora sp. M221]
MPFSANWQEKRLHLCVLAALSVTIMLFTGVHLRHMIPARQNWRHHGHPHVLDCDSFYAADVVECSRLGQVEIGVQVEVEMEVQKDNHNAGKEDWL